MSVGTNRKAAVEGDIVNGAVQCGQSLNRLTKVEPAKVIVDSVIAEAKEAIEKSTAFCLSFSIDLHGLNDPFDCSEAMYYLVKGAFNYVTF